MAYLAHGDFRPDAPMFQDCVLKDTEVEDARLTTEIATQSAVFEDLTGGKFETGTGTTYTYTGDGSNMLMTGQSPSLVSVASITETPIGGTASTLDSTTYRVRPWGIELATGSFAADRTYTLNTVAYGPATTPSDVKRAIALLVYHQLKGISPGTHRATRWQTADGTVFESPEDSITGIPEVDRIVKRHRSAPRVRWV